MNNKNNAKNNGTKSSSNKNTGGEQIIVTFVLLGYSFAVLSMLVTMFVLCCCSEKYTDAYCNCCQNTWCCCGTWKRCDEEW